MGGDLNLKKSWHPVLMSNQRRVWEEEKKALDERKRIEQMMKERQEERQIQELQEMQEAAGGKKRLNRVDWMYSGPSSGQVGTTEEMEGYLLGKRRIDGLLKGTENKKLEKAADQESFMALQNANTLRDTTSKIREDPMLAIKKQEQAAYEALMNDPVRRRLLLKAAGGDIRTKERDSKHRKHRHHSDRHDHYRNHRRRRTEDEDRDSRRSMHSHRRHSGSSSYSRSPPPRRQRSPSLYRRRFPSRDRARSRPTTLYKRARSPSTSRSRSPYRSPTQDRRLKSSKSWHNAPTRRRNSSSPDGLPQESKEDNRAVKLAAMQQAATELDQDREKRIAAISERERAEREEEDKARAKSAKYGGKGEFVHGLHRKAGELDIGERMRRGRGGLGKQGTDDD